MSTDTERHQASLDRQALLNALMLDMIANTDCSWHAAVAAVALWESHFQNHTAPVYGVVEFEDEKPNIVFDKGPTKRSLKIGCAPSESNETYWMITIQS